MKKHIFLSSAIIAVIRTALLIFLLISIIISTCANFLHSVVFNEELFKQQIMSDQYISEVTEYIDRTIKKKCMAYKIPYDEFRPIITDKKIHDTAQWYANALYKSLFNGTELEEVYYPSDDIFTYLNSYLQSKGIITSNSDIQIFADDIAHDITVNIVALDDSYGSVNLIKPLSSYIFNNVFLRYIAHYSDQIILACAFLTIITWLLCSANFLSGLFNLAAIYWFAGLFTFVPIIYFKSHNVLDGIQIGSSPLNSLISVFIPSIVDGLTTATMTTFIIGCVIMLYAIVMCFVLSAQKRKTATDASIEYTASEVHQIEANENIRTKINITSKNKDPDTVNSLIQGTDNTTPTDEQIKLDNNTDDGSNLLANLGATENVEDESVITSSDATAEDEKPDTPDTSEQSDEAYDTPLNKDADSITDTEEIQQEDNNAISVDVSNLLADFESKLNI